jgi:hypothetical protein
LIWTGARALPAASSCHTPEQSVHTPWQQTGSQRAHRPTTISVNKVKSANNESPIANNLAWQLQ